MVTDFKKKRNSLRQLLLKAGALLMLVVFGFLVAADIKIYQKKKELAMQVATLNNKVQDIQKENDNLQKGIANADNPEYIEKIAREELDLQKPGEKIVSFVMPVTQAPKSNANSKNTLQIWLGWIGGIFSKP